MLPGIPRKTTAAPWCAVALASFIAGGCGGGHVQRVYPEPPAATARLWGAQRVEKGTQVVVGLRDGRTVAGKYAGLEHRAEDDYADAYGRAREVLRGELELPVLGPGARLADTKGGESECALKAIGLGSVSLQLHGRKDTTRIPLINVARLSDAEGRTFTGPELEKLAVSGKVPLDDLVLVDSGNDRHKIRAEEVSRLELPEPGGHGVLIAAVVVVGLAVVALVAGSGSGGDEGGDWGGGGQSSCPFVYSFDGERFVLDAEPFSGATMEVAQRRDWSRLDHLRESGGTYRLKVANELPETEYVDEVKLLAVDHPPGTTVAPDLLGRLHVLSARGVGASSARDLDGADVRSLLEREDGRGWAGSPLAVDPEAPAEARDGVVLEFPRPAGATRAVLGVRARGTAWAPAVVRSVLSLQGRDLEAWYQRVAADRDLQARLDTLQRQAVPRVRLWTGGRWQGVSYLTAALPTAAPAVQAVPLELAAAGDVVRVRIDGLPGTWTLDHAAVDYEPEARADVTELVPEAARASNGRDALPALRDADGARHVLERGEAVEVAFAAPPARPSAVRSFVLKSAGYYKLHLRGEGEPRTAEFERLLSEPGALGRFAVARARAEVQAALEDAE